MGAKSVPILKTTSDTTRATLASAICGDGTFLVPMMLIFKGTWNRRIMKKDFPAFAPVCLFACQENAWMDEEYMITWVDKILAPYVSTAPVGIVPLLVLDYYRCHMMASSVVHRVQNLSVEVEHIPGGSTALCQPLDVGLNKPLKVHIRRKWNKWMVEEGVLGKKAAPPTRELIVQWTINSWWNLSEKNMKIPGGMGIHLV